MAIASLICERCWSCVLLLNVVLVGRASAVVAMPRQVRVVMMMMLVLSNSLLLAVLGLIVGTVLLRRRKVAAESVSGLLGRVQA